MHYKVMSIAVAYLASHVMQSFKLQLMNFQRYVIRYMLSSEFVKHLSPESELLIGKKKDVRSWSTRRYKLKMLQGQVGPFPACTPSAVLATGCSGKACERSESSRLESRRTFGNSLRLLQ